ncbi:hypothetical protein Nmel_004292 [Mimus melanotis]
MFWFAFFLCFSGNPPKKAKSGSCFTKENHLPQTQMQQSNQGAYCNLKMQYCRPWASSGGVLPKPHTLKQQTLVELCLVNHSYLASYLPSAIFAKCWAHDQKNVIG